MCVCVCRGVVWVFVCFFPPETQETEFAKKFCLQESLENKATVVVVTDDFIKKVWLI